MRRAFGGIFTILAAVLSLGAQQSSPTSANSASPSDRCSQQIIPLTPTAPAPAWDSHSLVLTVGGKQVPIEAVSVTPHPPRVLLLVDASGSMGPEPGGSSPNWGVGLRAAAFALDVVPPESPVSLGSFNEKDNFGKFETRPEVQKELMALSYQKPNHRTAIYEALLKAAAQFEPAQFGDTIFLVTDGGDNRSGELQKKARLELIARGIRVFVFLVVKTYKTPEEREGPGDMFDLAKATGGTLVQAPWSKPWIESEEAKTLLQQVRTMARWPYRLQFQLDRPLEKSAKLKISSARADRSLEFGYPREVLPCSAAPHR